MLQRRILPSPRSKHQVEAFLKTLENNPEIENFLHKIHTFPSTPWWDRPHENPSVRAWQECIYQSWQEAICDAQFKLSESVGRLAEQPEVLAHLSAVYVLVHKKLIPVALHNHWQRESGPIDVENDVCLVATAASQGKPYYAPDVHAPSELNYRNVCDATMSELVVPIHWNGELIGVINLESTHLNGLVKTLSIVESVIPSMIPEILVLKSCYSEDESWCPWNPAVHGWDLSKAFSKLLQSAGNENAAAAAKFAVWYPDWEKEILFAYAAFGYDWCYVDGDSLNLPGSEIGRALSSRKRDLMSLDVDQFIKHEKAMELGIDEAWLAPVFIDMDDEPTNFPCAGITCYFARNGRPIDAVTRNDRDLAKNAITQFAVFLGKFIESFQQQRKQLALAHIAAVNHNHRDKPQRTRFEGWLYAIQRIVHSPAGSVFHLKESNRLQCIASTGFYNPDRGTRSLKLATHFYNIDENELSHTVATFNLKGKSLRRLKLGNSQEKGLPKLVPEVADFHRNAEFLDCQPLNEVGNVGRQMLACAYRCAGKTAGVIRFIRGKHTRPFTACDARLLEEICKDFAPSGNLTSIATT